MEYVLEKFCQETGQWVNKGKPHIWFSPDTPIYVKGSICSNLGVVSTRTLVVYLGVPVLHGRVLNATYQYLLDKVNKKLAGWKLKTLSRVARVVLIKSSLAVIPIYSMQTMMVPKMILKGIERCCRRFFLGEHKAEVIHHSLVQAV